MDRYDSVLLGCECGEHDETKPDKAPMHDWLGEGGRLFATHYASTWFRNGPADFQSIAGWLPPFDTRAQPPYWVESATPEGDTYRSWLAGLSVLQPDPDLPLDQANVTESVSAATPAARVWIASGPIVSPVPKALTFPTPVGGAETGIDAGEAGAAPFDASAPSDAGSTPLYCGRATFTDVHAGALGSRARRRCRRAVHRATRA